MAMNDFERRLKDQQLQQQDRQRIEAELKAFRSQVCNGVTIKPVTYRNPQSQQDEASAEVFLEGTTEPLGQISRDQVPLVTSELTGVLVSAGAYTLKVLCPLGASNPGVRPSQPLGVRNIPLVIGDDPIPEADHGPTRSKPILSMEVVNGWQYKINHGSARQSDLDKWKTKAGTPATIRPTTFVRSGVSEPAVAVYLDGHGDQFGWVAKEHIPTVKQELHGYLAQSGPYTLAFICDQPA
jgi:hypothetical protein